MSEDVGGVRQDRAVWFLVGCVFCCVSLVLMAVFTHEKDKAQSPQALLAAALETGPLGIQEWKPGMGSKPFVYHPAAVNAPVWQPLYVCPQHGTVKPDRFDPAIGRPRCPLCGQAMVFTTGAGNQEVRGPK
ncbi:MAG TPA: hypothetical protein HPP81_06750 [Deltaproteobacteria bacterium]|jgi:hypothetical protein|nr:hypothetical protein [Deltaproteobacteria bacterium]HIJ76400.1 hypothetical protein [Deltaproteobacteria bacterium]